jgi:uncharacterized protein YndB with AHSA1/START domain
MTRIYSASVIQQPVEHVFEYVTTPGNWPRWHPSSLAVSGSTNHSLDLGEQVMEEFLVAGRLGRAVWTVIEREDPNRWVIDGRIAGSNNGGRVIYTVRRQADGSTFFERELYYRLRSPIHRLLESFLIRRRIEAESLEAVQRLKHRLEDRTDFSPTRERIT